MLAPNWFDRKYADAMKDMTAEACLSLVLSDPKIIQAVKDAFASMSPIGPNKAQAVRTAVCAALQ